MLISTNYLYPVFSFLICFLVIYFLRPFAFSLGLVDNPGERKRHVGAIPLIGGVAIFITLLFMTMLLNLTSQKLILPFMTCLSILVILGIADDRHELSSLSRLAGQFFVALITVFFGNIKILSFGNILGVGSVDLNIWTYIITPLAIVMFINAANMLDGSDGVAGGLNLVQLGLFFFTAFGITKHILEKNIILCLLGCILAFLYFNFPYRRAKSALIFLGDAGSMLLGFSSVWVAIAFSQGNEAIIAPVIVLWILSITLFDFFTVFIKRICRGTSPLKAGRDHLHHTLQNIGLSRMQVALVIMIGNLLLGILGIVLNKYVSNAISFALFLMIFFIYFFILNFLSNVATRKA